MARFSFSFEALRQTVSNIRKKLATPFEDQVVAFLASKLEQPTVGLLITDPAMRPVYEHIHANLKAVSGWLSTASIEDLDETVWTEVIIVHSVYDPALLRRVVDTASVERIIYIALDHFETDEVSTMCEKLMKSGAGYTGSVDVVFAYSELHKTPRYEYPVDSHELHAMWCAFNADKQ